MSVVAFLLLFGTAPGPFQATTLEASLHRYTPAPPPQAPADRWLGPDKARHALHAYAAVAFGHAGATALGLEGDDALVAALAVGTVAGVAKEVLDRRRGGPFSGRDLVWDAVGMGLGALVFRALR